MGSINALKGYGKVESNLDGQNPNDHHPSKTSQKPRFRIITLSFSAIIFSILIVALVAATVFHHSKTNPPPPSAPLPSSTASAVESIRTVCNVTQYPASCFATLVPSLNNSSSTKLDPESIFKLSLRVSIAELTNFSSLLRTINDAGSKAAVEDCLSLSSDALGRLNDSLSAMEVGAGEKVLTSRKINDIQTWISAAMTDQDTCVEGLEEMGSAVLDEVKSKMEMSKQCLSNSLAIIAKMQSLLDKFGLKLY